MTPEEKQLLIKDLASRLPYGVIVQIQGRYDDGEECIRETEFDSPMFGYLYDDEKTIIPYLRPMSSMTEEEGKELEHIFSEIDASCWVDTEYGCVNFAGGNDFIDAEMAEVYIDWLNKKMFDYRGLIERGLALEAPEDMYK